MPYLGNIPASAFSGLSYQDLTGGTGTSFTLDYSVSSAQDIEVFVNNVRQEPGVAYTVAGTALTMTGSIVATDDFYVVFQAKTFSTVSHPAGNTLQATSGTFSGGVTMGGTLGVTGAATLSSTLGVTGKITSTAGITFGSDTAAENVLDDYEEGTWTPVDGSGAGLSLTQGVTSNYMKIGRLVLFNFYVIYPSTSNTATASIGGLPYAVTSSGYFYANYRTGALGANNLLIQLNQGSTVMSLYNADAGYNNATLSGNYILAAGSYMTS